MEEKLRNATQVLSSKEYARTSNIAASASDELRWVKVL
jgi:hypothetical protein